jgi:hypothetical protein
LKYNEREMLEYLPETAVAARLFWLSGAFAFLVATATGIFAGPKYWRELQAREWDRAHQAYEKFLDVAIQHPKFVSGYWSCPDLTAEDRNQYRWFMARFLWAAEQALLRVSWWRRKEWKRAIKVMLREHADFIAAPEARDEVDCYYGPLKKLIRDVIEEARVLDPPPAPSTEPA